MASTPAKPCSRGPQCVKRAALDVKSLGPNGFASVNVAGRDTFITRQDSSAWDIIKELGTFDSRQKALFIDLEPEVFAVLWRYLSPRCLIDPAKLAVRPGAGEIVESLLDGGVLDIPAPTALGYTALWCPYCLAKDPYQKPLITFYGNSTTTLYCKHGCGTWDENTKTVRCNHPESSREAKIARTGSEPRGKSDRVVTHPESVWKVELARGDSAGPQIEPQGRSDQVFTQQESARKARPSHQGSGPQTEPHGHSEQAVMLWKPKVSGLEQARGRTMHYVLVALEDKLPEFKNYNAYFS